MTTRGRVEIAADAEAVAARAATMIETAAAESIAARGRFLLALAGGATPRTTYARLADRNAVDWARVHVVWSDERAVPPEHDASNYRMTREALLDRVSIPQSQIHRLHGEALLDEEATRYERALRALVAESRIDLALLGIGADGHTASLFPDDLGDPHDRRWVRTVAGSATRAPRLTLTPAVLADARTILFLATGADKAAAVAAAVEGPDDSRLPALRLAHAARDVRWLLDRAAARRLTPARGGGE